MSVEFARSQTLLEDCQDLIQEVEEAGGDFRALPATVVFVKRQARQLSQSCTCVRCVTGGPAPVGTGRSEPRDGSVREEHNSNELSIGPKRAA